MRDHVRRNTHLRSLGRLLRAEFKASAADWRELFADAPDAGQLLDEEIALADHERIWQTILVGTNEIVEDAWNALDAKSQACVLQRFARQWASRRAPMPVENAQALKGLLIEGKLKLVRGPVCFDRSSADQIRMSCMTDGKCADYDYVINATGASRYIERPEDSQLCWQLVNEGLASPDWRGGIRVDFASGALIDRQGEPDWQLRALGHITSGTYFFVSSLEMVARRARRIAADFASVLAEEDITLRATAVL